MKEELEAVYKRLKIMESFIRVKDNNISVSNDLASASGYILLALEKLSKGN